MSNNILDRFEETVRQKPDAAAVVHGNETLTFLALEKRSRALGRMIIEQLNQQKNRPVAVFLNKELLAVIADLGILYSANTFMNLDVKMPEERLKNIINHIRPAAVITSEKYVKTAEKLGIPVIVPDFSGADDSADDTDTLAEYRSTVIDTDPMCIINTSGSTGTPKGVVLNQRSFFDFMRVSSDIFHFDGSEVIGSLSPIVFDIFDFELCMLMMYGSQIVLLDGMLASFPARLLETMANAHISFIFWVPSIMVSIANLNLLQRIPLPDLRMVWFAGEVFPTKQFLVWYDTLPETTFANLYGPIEITLDCTYYVVKERPQENEPLPIGIPYQNTDVLILNDEDRVCKPGEEGELCVRGTSLAMGYYNDPDKTAAAFVQNPLNKSYPEIIYRTGDIVCMRSDGNILFKGRKDSLIKHSGYRIELGEIEHVLENELKAVKYCCAVYHYQEKKIVLFYENDRELSAREFRQSMHKHLPNYMIPAEFIRMDELPRNPNGKIDRLALKKQVNEPTE